jgi:GTP:adenosylcobinamide-phosphate guanylyltransferase
MGSRRRQRGVVAAGLGAGSAADFEETEVFMATDLVDNINTVADLVDIVNQTT